jgi:hypothetical protein
VACVEIEAKPFAKLKVIGRAAGNAGVDAKSDYERRNDEKKMTAVACVKNCLRAARLRLR